METCTLAEGLSNILLIKQSCSLSSAHHHKVEDKFLTYLQASFSDKVNGGNFGHVGNFGHSIGS